MAHTVLLTDYAWPDDSIERSVIELAGMRFVAGAADALPAGAIEALVREHQPSAILTCWGRVSAEAIAAAPALRIVARLGVGLDNIAIEAATARGIWVTNVPDYCVEEVSDHAVAFVLAWTRGIARFDREVRAGRWAPASAKLRRLSQLSCGIIGFGRIGRATARKLRAFGSGLLAYDPFMAGDENGVRCVDLDTLLSSSDVVIVHAPLTDETRHLINRERLALMKPGGLLVNVSRGAIVETDAVIEALRAGRLSAAGLDVLEAEPETPPELLEHPGVIMTPHIAFSSDASLDDLRRSAAEEVVRVLSGLAPRQPRNKPLRVLTRNN